jgi:hypothetical protein
MITLKQKAEATKCSEHCTVSLITPTAKIEVLKEKLRMYFEKTVLYSEEEKELWMQVEY